MTFARTLLAASALALAVMVPATSFAQDADADRIAKAGHSLKWNWTPPGKSEKYGHGEVLIHAPLSAVRAQVQDFSAYREFAPRKFKTSKRLATKPNGVEVQLVFKVGPGGLISLEPVLLFGAPRSENGWEVVEGTYARGNVKAANVVWSMKAVSPEWTVLKCDILLLPDMPVPRSALDEELRDAAQQAVDKIHDKAQGHTRWDPYNG